MTAAEILAGGGIVLAAMTLIQIAPIKLDPWSAIARAVGRAINKDVIDKLDETREILDTHIKMDGARTADAHRARILQFNNELLRDIPHTQEEFVEILAEIDQYEKYCKANPDLGTVLGFLVCGATARRLHRNTHGQRTALKARDDPKKMGVMDKVLVLEGVILVAYTVAALAVFWHTGGEPSTLTACVFGVCGLENGVMGWIKTNKDKAAEAARTSGSGYRPAPEEPPTDRTEPPDVGI